VREGEDWEGREKTAESMAAVEDAREHFILEVRLAEVRWADLRRVVGWVVREVMEVLLAAEVQLAVVAVVALRGAKVVVA
jgi:hypothetical protein